VRPGTTTALGHVQSTISREHYLMWKPSATGAFVRLGRFYAPYGLRLAEHPYYVRRFTGFNLYEETYNLSGGYLDEDWELHVTAFTPPPSGFPTQLQSVGMRGSGGAVYGEKRFASMASVGLQTRVAINKEQRLIQGGAVGKIWIDGARLLIMGEFDLQQRTPSATGGFTQTVGYLGLTFFPIKGLMGGLALDRRCGRVRSRRCCNGRCGCRRRRSLNIGWGRHGRSSGLRRHSGGPLRHRTLLGGCCGNNGCHRQRRQQFENDSKHCRALSQGQLPIRVW
jgi:hypothetical protein